MKIAIGIALLICLVIVTFGGIVAVFAAVTVSGDSENGSLLLKINGIQAKGTGARAIVATAGVGLVALGLSNFRWLYRNASRRAHEKRSQKIKDLKQTIQTTQTAIQKAITHDRYDTSGVVTPEIVKQGRVRFLEQLTNDLSELERRPVSIREVLRETIGFDAWLN